MVRQQTPRAWARGWHDQWPVALGAGMIATIGFPLSGSAQNVADVQRELTEMRRYYDAELKRLQHDYDGRLRRLEAQLKAAQRKPATASSRLVEPVAESVAPSPPPAPVTALPET